MSYKSTRFPRVFNSKTAKRAMDKTWDKVTEEPWMLSPTPSQQRIINYLGQHGESEFEVVVQEMARFGGLSRVLKDMEILGQKGVVYFTSRDTPRVDRASRAIGLTVQGSNLTN